MSNKTQIWRKTIFVLVASFVFLGPAFLNASIETDLSEYLKLFQKDYIPTIEDFNAVASHEDFDEDEFESCLCDKLGAGATAEERCKNFRAIRKNQKQSPSLYFEWLRTILPLSPKVEIVNVTTFKTNSTSTPEITFSHQEVRVRLNDIYVTFLRKTRTVERSLGGPFILKEIGNYDVDELMRDYLAHYISEYRIWDSFKKEMGERKNFADKCGEKIRYLRRKPDVLKEFVFGDFVHFGECFADRAFDGDKEALIVLLDLQVAAQGSLGGNFGPMLTKVFRERPKIFLGNLEEFGTRAANLSLAYASDRNDTGALSSIRSAAKEMKLSDSKEKLAEDIYIRIASHKK